MKILIELCKCSFIHVLFKFVDYSLVLELQGKICRKTKLLVTQI